MERVKNEHFVPQSYLNYFANLQNKKKGIYQTNVYDKVRKKWYLSNVDKVAAEGKYFELPEVNSDSFNEAIKIINKEQLIEKFFSSAIEIPYKKYLDNIRSNYIMQNKPIGKQALNNFQKQNLSILLIIQFLRTRSYRNHTNEMEYKLLKMMMDKLSNSNSEESFEVPEVSSKVIQTSLVMNPDTIASFATEIYNHCWVVIVNKTSEVFITSDNPIVKRPHITDKFTSYSGFASKGIEIAFPISPSLLLVMYERSYHKDVLKFENSFVELKNSQIVKQYNSWQIADASSQIFSKDKSFLELIDNIKNDHPQLLEERSNIEIHHNGKVY